ncbi:MAG: MFS transporter [Candidatus Latescibacteria bacterium]|nr:MFS transporter [Candidatus Latescibacterota bacterium]
MTVSSRGTTIRLSTMMFIEFAIWGSWAVLIAGHMVNLGFSGKQISYVFGTTAFGALVSPLVAGWVADRYMPNQIFTALCHFAGAPLMYLAWQQTTFAPLWTVVFIYAVLYMPTIAMTNAIAFHHMGDSKKFGNIRVWGTLGWIVINWGMSAYLRYWEVEAPGQEHVGDCLLVAAALSVLMGIYCLTLPNTPPAKEAKNPYAFLEALKLTENRNFAVLLVISFVVAIELPFYYNLTFLFLTEPGSGVGLAPSTANFAMSLGQVGEVLLMILLAPSLIRLGMRMTIFLGILAWPVRYAIFAIGQPAWLVVAAQPLHGICYSFFFVGGMIAAERLSHRDIRASAQGLMIFATNGLGMLVGHFFSGQIHDYFALPDGGHSWPMIFLVPIALTVVAAVVFLAMFDEGRYQADTAVIETEDTAA